MLRGTVTDHNSHFERSLDQSPQTITISLMGYENQELMIKKTERKAVKSQKPLNSPQELLISKKYESLLPLQKNVKHSFGFHGKSRSEISDNQLSFKISSYYVANIHLGYAYELFG